MGESQELQGASRFHTVRVWRQGGLVLREPRPWSKTVHAFLRHLEAEGFAGAPRVAGTGFDAEGNETLGFVEGETMAKGAWSVDGATAVGHLLGELHQAAKSFQPPEDAVWMPWQGREQGSGNRVISHCDTAAWNIVALDGMPCALIDWERAGPVDPLVELAQCCWLNGKLFDDIVARVENLPPPHERARLVRAILDGYGLPRRKRTGFLEVILEFVVRATAEEADEAQVTERTASAEVAAEVVWALSWRARSAAWILDHRAVLQEALTS